MPDAYREHIDGIANSWAAFEASYDRLVIACRKADYTLDDWGKRMTLMALRMDRLTFCCLAEKGAEAENSGSPSRAQDHSYFETVSAMSVRDRTRRR